MSQGVYEMPNLMSVSWNGPTAARNWKLCIDLSLSEWLGADWILGFVDCLALNVCVAKQYFMLELSIKMNW